MRTNKSLEIDENKEKVDERDIMFAREEYTPGSPEYEKYYSTRPENKDIDDEIRNLPEMFNPGGHYYEEELANKIKSMFQINKDLTKDVDGEINSEKTVFDPAMISNQIKDMVLIGGASDVGIAKLNPMYVYSNVGRGPEEWGSSITNNHKYAIMLCLEMDYSQVEKAPRLNITEETAIQYLSGAVLSIALAKYIRNLGYSARAHIAGSNYQIMLPPVAYDAGLGELGRNGFLISPRFGARIRLGAVTTDLPLINDKPKIFGVQNFCEKCLKCAENCPSGAILKGDKEWVRGVKKWQLNIEKCIRYWRIAGTDCGMCMKVCPYSHPNTFVHNIVRLVIKRSSLARSLSIFGDDLLYGKKFLSNDVKN